MRLPLLVVILAITTRNGCNAELQSSLPICQRLCFAEGDDMSGVECDPTNEKCPPCYIQQAPSGPLGFGMLTACYSKRQDGKCAFGQVDCESMLRRRV